MRAQLFKHKTSGWQGGAYVSPYLLEILSTRPGAPRWTAATGSLVANTGQVVLCSRASAGYCLGDDGFLHLLGVDAVRVEPKGLLTEGQSTNYMVQSNDIGNGPGWANFSTVAGPTITLASTDVLDPAGGHASTKIVFSAVPSSGSDYSFTAQNPAVVADTTVSIYARCDVGTATIYMMNNANHASIALNLTTTWQRFSMPIPGFGNYILFGSDTRPGNGNSPGIAACTVYLWGAQQEPLPFASSLIATTNAAATRATEVLYVDVTSLWGALPAKPYAMRADVWSMKTPLVTNDSFGVMDWGNGEVNRCILDYRDTGGGGIGFNMELFERDSSGASASFATSNVDGQNLAEWRSVLGVDTGAVNGMTMSWAGVVGTPTTGLTQSGHGPNLHLGTNYANGANLYGWLRNMSLNPT